MGLTDERQSLPVSRAAELAPEPPERRWLIRSLWAREGVGILGGPPKVCKSWMGLDVAVSVASATPCLGRFAVDAPGPALVFLAEDELSTVRARIEALCAHRGLAIAALDLHVITASALRLDLPDDQQRLADTVARLRPRLLLLDPLVRLHQLSENSAADISRLLGYLRELQRAHHCAVVLVHHASKKVRSQPGQALRGSSDLHAFGSNNAYLRRDADNQLLLTLEHRAARAPEPMRLALVSRPDGSATHLEVLASPAPDALERGPSLTERALDALRAAQEPVSRAALRETLRVNNARLGDALSELQRLGRLCRTAQGWALPTAADRAPATAGLPPQQLELMG